MKIGIISINMYSKGLNFACPLHTWAFQQFLLQQGIACTVIDYQPVYYNDFDLKNPGAYYRREAEKTLHRLAQNEKERAAQEKKRRECQRQAEVWEKMRAVRRERYEKFQNFIETHYQKTGRCYNSDLLEFLDPGFDCYICATDVIWKRIPGEGYDRGFFLGSSCMEGKGKIAYSASRGVPSAQVGTEEEKKLFFHYLADLDFISVREPSLKAYIEENSSIGPVTVVLDPVLLHEADFYEKILKKPEEESYVFLYYVMEKASDTIRKAAAYARKYHKKLIEVTDQALPDGRLGDQEGLEREYRYGIGIEEWLGYLRYADCVFTNSFHACCFCILFQKEFYVGSRHGDKVQNIMQTFGLQERLLQSQEEPPVPKPVDYAPVQRLLQKKREQSAAWILGAIHALEERQSDPAYKKEAKEQAQAQKRALRYPVRYNSVLKSRAVTSAYPDSGGTLSRFDSGTLEFEPFQKMQKNDGSGRLAPNRFRAKGRHFTGWHVRMRVDQEWFWYLKDGTWKYRKEYREAADGPRYLFHEEEQLPCIPANRISMVVAEAVWKEKTPTKLKKQARRLLKKVRSLLKGVLTVLQTGD